MEIGVMAAATGLLVLTKTMVVLWLVGRSLGAADRKEGDDRTVLRRRAFRLGMQEVVWFFGACTLFSVI